MPNVKGLVLTGLMGVLAACSAGKPDTAPASDVSATPSPPAEACASLPDVQDVTVPGGVFRMGADNTYPEEGPSRTETVDAFVMDATEVTNDAFAAFVADTGYVTVAERKPDPSVLPEGSPPEYYEPGAVVFQQPRRPDENWWVYVPGANWQHPSGAGSSIEGLGRHPVVQIGYEDAVAYAEWAGRRLPTEAEWEFAARGGLDGATYEWGETPPVGDKPRANTWQGVFPVANTEDDGFFGTAPAGCFDPNAYGLHDMTGNVWEWTASLYQGGESPTGERVHVVKGGSYLCASNFCVRYRPAARQGQEAGLPTNHIGFRTVRERDPGTGETVPAPG